MWSIMLLLPIGATLLPAEIVFPLFYLAPSKIAAACLFVLACTVSIAQMLYQHWAVGQAEQMAPGATERIESWLRRQPIVQAILPHMGLTLFLTAALPCIRSVGVAMWKATRYPRGGYYLSVGTVLQLGYTFSVLLGLGRLIQNLFR
jgi:hypothetical protein